MTNIENSPLRKYYRQPKIELKLPTNGLWYDNDVLDLNENATVKVLSMSGLDEIKCQTPEIIAESKFKYELIKSCVPEIKKPEKLCFVDVRSIMFAIYVATYGKYYKEEFICNHCAKKSENMSEEKRKLAEENCQINIKPQKVEISSQAIIDQTVYATTKDIYVDYGDLRLYLKPVEASASDKLDTEQFYESMIANKLEEYQNNPNIDEEVIKKAKNEILEITNKIYNNAFDMLILSIDYIVIKSTNQIISDRVLIADFIKNSSNEIIELIKNKRDKEIDILGLPYSYKVECNTCHQLVDINTIVFNPTNFFDIAS